MRTPRYQALAASLAVTMAHAQAAAALLAPPGGSGSHGTTPGPGGANVAASAADAKRKDLKTRGKSATRPVPASEQPVWVLRVYEEAVFLFALA